MPKLGLYSTSWQLHDQLQFGASDFWRLAVPGRELARNGWNIVLGREIQAATGDGRFMLKDEYGGIHDNCDIVLMQRYMGENAVSAIKRAQATGQTIVNDVDDFYWAFPRTHVSRNMVDSKDSHNTKHYREILKASSFVTVSTPWLQKAISKWNPDVRVARNYVPLDKWEPKPPGEYIGWVGVIPWRDTDLQQLLPTVIPWLKEHNRPFYHGGEWPDGRKARDILGHRTITRLATPLPDYASLWDPLQIALIPLENSTFNQAKSWCKGLEACARGIPYISSKHAEYEALGGRIARRPYEWAKHLDELQDPSVYAEECAQSRARAEELSMDRNWREWESVLTL